MRKAFFFDRDGVLIKDSHLVKSIDEVELVHGASSFVKEVRRQGFLTFIVTNQTVVSRGILSLEKTEALNEEIIKKLCNEDSEVAFEKVYICPHHPDAQVIEYAMSCDCRKPKPGMLLRAKEEFDLNLCQSFMIGDRPSDIVAGNSAGVKTIQLFTQSSGESMIRSEFEFSKELKVPSEVFYSFKELSNYFKNLYQG